jgi:hypothetical protein
MHAQQLRNAVRAAAGDPVTLVSEFDQRTEAEVTPYYRGQVAVDRVRVAEMTAIREGTDPPPPDPARLGWLAGVGRDPMLFRGIQDVGACLAHPQEVMARPGFRERALSFADGPAPVTPGPDREQLLRLVAG